MSNKFKFGDPITNVCAGEENPKRHSYYVETERNSRKNKFGITHTHTLIKCTDRKGNFWKTDPQVIFPGHLSYEESKNLYAPIWEKQFGKAGQS